MSYYGHVVRKHNSLEKEVRQGCTPGSSRGRQRRRWTDDISEWSVMTINDAAREAEDVSGERFCAPPSLHMEDATRRQRSKRAAEIYIKIAGEWSRQTTNFI